MSHSRRLLRHAAILLVLALVAAAGASARPAVVGASAAAPVKGVAAAPRARVATTPAEVTPVADAFVTATQPGATFGTLAGLEVAASPRKFALLRFALAGITSPVTRATLSLQVVQGSASSYEVRSLPARPWNEQSISYRTAPAVLSGTAVKIVAPLRGTRATVDVTSLVKAGATVDLAVLAFRAAAPVAFASREAGVSAPKLTLELAAAPAAPPANPYRGRVGVAGASIWSEDADQLAHLRRAHDAGLTWIREDFHWGAYERSPGVWNWAIGDRMMRNASTVGVDVLGVIAYSAEWAASGPNEYYPPRDPNQYANFCRELVKRYGAGGTFWALHPELTPRPLKAVEIWNEPWLPNFWRPNPDPAAYARLARTAATAIRAANPSVKILVNGDIFSGRTDSTQSFDWLAKLLQLDPGLFRDLTDAYSVHAYVQNRDPRDAVTAQRWRFDRVLLTRDLAAAAGASHPIWITEFGWSTYAGNPDSVSEAKQAEYTAAALKLAVEQWGGLVERSFVYYLGKGVNDYVGGYSMHRPDGSAKPVWDAVTALTR